MHDAIFSELVLIWSKSSWQINTTELYEQIFQPHLI